MSLYRQSTGMRRGTLIAAIFLCLVAGFGAGFAVGRGSAPDPDLAELAAEARAQARPALSALELVTIEYREAVRGGKVVAATEYEAAAAHAASAADAMAASAPALGELDPEALAEAEAGVDEVVRSVDETADAGSVEAAAARATRAVEALVEAPSAG